jgi:WD40 repeat protein
MSNEHTIESLRELRFSANGRFLAGWGRLSLHVWDTSDGSLQWSYPLDQRAVSAHYSLDVVLQEVVSGSADIWLALPLQLKDPLAPRVHGVRGTDVLAHALESAPHTLSEPLSCVESEIEKREFWAIRLRALAPDLRTLLTLSCANVPDETEQMIVLRRWDLASKARFGGKVRPQISVAILAGLCAQCAPPYAVTPDLNLVAFVHADKTIRLHDTLNGSYIELASGSMGASSRLAIAPDGEWLAVAREDSEVNEGVIDLWSTQQNSIVQRLYHPWQVSALHFAGKRLIVALTDGTIQIWD